MRMGQCSVACVAKQGAKIRFHEKAAEILKTSALTEHVAGQDHREALCVPAQQKKKAKKKKKKRKKS